MLHFHTRSVHEYVNNMVIIEIQYSSQQSISTLNISVYNMISKFVIIKCPHDNLTNLTFFFWTVTYFWIWCYQGGLTECSSDSQ